MKFITLRVFILLIVTISHLPSICFAMPPSARTLEIYVKGISSPCYVDALVKQKESNYVQFNNKYDSSLKDSSLYKYRDKEWMAFFIRDVNCFTVDSVAKNANEKDVVLYRFMSISLGNVNFKVIVQDSNGNLIVSNNAVVFDNSGAYIFDIERKEIKKINPYHEMYINGNYNFMSVIMSALFIMIIKLLLAIPFKIRPLDYVILASVVTQVLTQLTTAAMYTLTLFDYLPSGFIIISVLALPIEYAIYKKFTVPISITRLTLYVFIANFSTFFFGLILHI